MRLTISPLGNIGLVADIEPYELTQGAWSAVKNMRFESGAAKRGFGAAKAMNPESGTPLSGTPLNIFGFASDVAAYWVVATQDKLWLSERTGATQMATGFTATDSGGGWQKTVLNGIAVLNNRTNKPQSWAVGTTPVFVDLPNWPATLLARRVIAYKNYLVALNVTKGATAYPTMVKWSHQADPGLVPGSWDETDPTKDAGEFALGDGFDEILDGEVMGDALYIYKRRSVWAMQFIGGTLIFRFWPVFQDVGLLAPRCVVNLPGRQFFVAFEGLYVHNGQTYEEVSNDRVRRMFFRDINYQYSYLMYALHNSPRNEIWVFYVSTASTTIDKVLIWNYKENTWTTRQFTFTALSADIGRLLEYNTDAWDSSPGGWPSDTLPWDFDSYALYGFKMVSVDPSLVLRVLDVGTTEDGTVYEAYVERTAMPLPSRADKPHDLGDLKFIRGIYPKITGEAGTDVEVYVGYQFQPDEAVTWQGPFTYTIGTTTFIPCRVTGRLMAIKFRSNGSHHWQVMSFQIDYDVAGRF